MSSVRLALIQFSTEGVSNIKEKAYSLIEEAVKENPDFIVLPEIFTTRYFPQFKDDSSFELAETIPGPTTDEIFELIKGKAVTIIASIYEYEKESDSYFCSAAILNGDKGYLGKYRKLHIPSAPSIHEVYFFKPGDLGHVVFETEKAKFSVMLCYDRHFPESARIYGLKNVDILFVCSATPISAKPVWQSELCSHAYINGYYVACANRVGIEDNIKFLGNSLVCDYRGELKGTAGDNEEKIIVTDVDIDEARNYREKLTFYSDRRPSLYKDLAKE